MQQWCLTSSTLAFVPTKLISVPHAMPMGALDIDPLQPETARSTRQLNNLGSAPSREDAHSGQIQGWRMHVRKDAGSVGSCVVWGNSEEAKFCSGVDRILGDPCWRMKTSAWSRRRLTCSEVQQLPRAARRGEGLFDIL